MISLLISVTGLCVGAICAAVYDSGAKYATEKELIN